MGPGDSIRSMDCNAILSALQEPRLKKDRSDTPERSSKPEALYFR